MKTSRQRHHTINPPQYPRQGRHPLSPSRHTHQYRHIDDYRQPNGKCRHKQTLVRVPKDSSEESRVHGISQAGDEGEREEQDEVEHEEDDGDDAKPVPVVGELVEHD